jgi:hypothetical protein
MEASVLGLVDDAHTATAELFNDAVMGDGLADHGEGEKLRGVMLWRRKLVVNGACGDVPTGIGINSPHLGRLSADGRTR